MNCFTWQDVLNHLQNLTPEQLNQPVQCYVRGGDYMTFDGVTTETVFNRNGQTVDVPVLTYN